MSMEGTNVQVNIYIRREYVNSVEYQSSMCTQHQEENNSVFIITYIYACSCF